MQSQSQLNIIQSPINDLNRNDSVKNTILLPETKNGPFLDVHTLDLPNQADPFALIDQLIAHKAIIPISESIAYDETEIHPTAHQLAQIAQAEQLLKTEFGKEELYIGYPMVEGTFADGTVVQNPLLLFPVSLSKNYQEKGFVWELVRRDENVSFNRALLLDYAQHTNIRIFDTLLDYNFDELPKSTSLFEAKLFELLRVSPLNIAVNRDLFTNTLSAISPKGINNTETTTTEEELQLIPNAILGIFEQGSSFQVNDEAFLQDHFGKTITTNAQLFEHLNKDVLKKAIKAEDLMLPLAADNTQEAIIREIKSGRSLVVQGPPGTGKTQLISNTIADFIARQKSVLVISEKRNALDNIQHILSKIGIGAFIANIHDFKNDKKKIFKHLAKQIDAYKGYVTANAEIDIINLEHRYNESSHEIERIIAQLDAYENALFDTSIAGITVQELYQRTPSNSSPIDLSDCLKAFRLEHLKEFWQKLAAYLTYQEAIFTTSPDEELEEDAQFWNFRPLYDQMDKADISLIAEIIEEVCIFANNLRQTAPQLTSIASLTAMEDDLPTFNTLFSILNHERIYKLLCRNLHTRIVITEEEMRDLENEVKGCFAGQGIEITIPSPELEPFLAKLKETIHTKSKAFGGVLWGMFGNEKKQITEVTSSNGLSTSLTDLIKLEERIQNRIKLEAWWANWAYLFTSDTGLEATSQAPTWLRKGYRWFERNFNDLRLALQAEQHWREIHSISLSTWRDLSWSDFNHKKKQLHDLINHWTTHKAEWTSYLSTWQLDYLIKNQDVDLISITSFLITKFNLLQEADTIRHSFSTEEWTAIERSLDYNNVENTPTILANAINNAWIEQIELQHPILKKIGINQLIQFQENLNGSITEKQQLSEDILLYLLREYCYKQIEHHEETYRELKHQVSKKRNVWSMKQVFQGLASPIFSLNPCWLTTPANIPNVFPIGKNPLFDLVIVDEASLCDASNALSILLRGKQVLIVGDSQQLGTNYANPTTEKKTSLLELAIKYLPQYQLTNHYRSHAAALISFSNTHFYDDELQLINTSDSLIRSIHHSNVNGNYQHGINKEEAHHVILIAQHILDTTPEKTIGVITFNDQQRQYIHTLLEQTLGKGINKDRISVTTANLVQGDEYDISIISFAYAITGSHSLAQQLESLTGLGPALLNVATTRAKEQTYLLTSFEPNELPTIHNENVEVYYLQEYLNYVLAME